MAEPALKLVIEATPTEGPFPLERRGAVRRRLTTDVTAIVIGEPFGASVHRLLTLETLDLSDTGLGAVSPDPVDEGSELRLFFPPHGGEPGFELRGFVTRCVEKGGHYLLGVSFGRRPSAA